MPARPSPGNDTQSHAVRHDGADLFHPTLDAFLDAAESEVF